jgi:tetratricopeptide (TPR) repeat protein
MKNQPALTSALLVAIGFLCLQLWGCTAAPATMVANSMSAAPDSALLKQADDCYAERDQPERLRAGLDLLRRARAVTPNNYDAAWRQARLAYTLGDQSEDDKVRTAAFNEGVEAGEIAVRVAPDKAESHFWLGANYGGLAETGGTLSGLSYADKLRREMEAVEKIDPTLYGGSPFMVLGRLDLELPGWLGGDKQRAQATLEKGLQYGAQNSMLRLELAKAYLANKRPGDARKQLNFILTMKPDAAYLPEYKQSVTEARDLLKQQK